MLHDCYGSMVERMRNGREYRFLCADCGKTWARLTIQGLRAESRHGGKVDKNVASFKTLRRLMADVETAEKRRAARG